MASVVDFSFSAFLVLLSTVTVTGPLIASVQVTRIARPLLANLATVVLDGLVSVNDGVGLAPAEPGSPSAWASRSPPG